MSASFFSCPEASFLKAKLVSGNHRVRRFFGEEADQYRHLNAMRTALDERLRLEAQEFHQSRETASKFSSKRAPIN